MSDQWDDLAKQSKLQSNPVATSGRIGAPPGMPQTPKQQANVKAEGPIYTGLSNIMSIPNTPGAMLGAMLRDKAAGRQVGGDQPQGARTAEAHFLEQLGRAPAEAVNEYFATSPTSMRQYSQGTGAIKSIGDYFVKHPKQNAALDFIGRILDPGNALTFETVGGVNDILKTGVRTAARKAASEVIKRAPEAAAHPLVRHLMSAENLGSFNRFAEVRSAAEDAARGKGWNPTDVTAHGDAAEMASRNIANSPKYAKGMAQRAANDVFKGLTKGEQFTVVNMIEGDSPLLGDVSKLSPGQIALRDRLMPRVTKYREWRARVDEATKKYNVADEGRFLRGDNFFSRAGMFVDPENEAGEEMLPENEAFRREFNTGTNVAVRKGTLGENIHRQYPTLKSAQRAGMQLRPDVTPMKAFEMHVYGRTQSARINEQLDKLQEVGLIQPKNEPVPFSIGVTNPVPQPPGYADFSSLGSMRQFGSNITRDAWVHPSIPSLIEDVAATHATRRGLSHVIPLVGAAMRTANRVLSSVEVSNPAWHLGFNIDENVLSEAPNPIAMATKGFGKQAVESAEQEGVHLPFSRRQSASDWGRPFSDLTAKEKAMRLIQAGPHALESFASAPLYSHGEPVMATAAHAGLVPRLGKPGAAIAVRSMLGEPENLGAATEGVAPLLQFPSWMLSQLRRWPKALAQRPWLYNSPHAAARDIDASQGRGPRFTDEGKMIPPIVLGKDKNGDFNMLTIPHPGNRASELGTAILKGDKMGIAYALAGGVNPLLQQPVWSTLQNLSSEQKKNLAAVAPQNPTALGGAMDYIKGFARFSPARSLVSKELSPERAASQRQLINAFLYGHGGRHREAGLVEIRTDQAKAERMGDTFNADRLRKAGDDMYARMVQRLTSQGFPAP